MLKYYNILNYYIIKLPTPLLVDATYRGKERLNPYTGYRIKRILQDDT
jgi:hypothetical protein